MNLTWYYLHWVAAIAIAITDYTGHLEPFVNDFERKIGLYTPPDTTQYEEPPYYIPPIDDDILIDSTMVIVNRGENGIR